MDQRPVSAQVGRVGRRVAAVFAVLVLVLAGCAKGGGGAVSYTHLTLPTIYSV